MPFLNPRIPPSSLICSGYSLTHATLCTILIFSRFAHSSIFSTPYHWTPINPWISPYLSPSLHISLFPQLILHIFPTQCSNIFTPFCLLKKFPFPDCTSFDQVTPSCLSGFPDETLNSPLLLTACPWFHYCWWTPVQMLISFHHPLQVTQRRHSKPVIPFLKYNSIN